MNHQDFEWNLSCERDSFCQTLFIVMLSIIKKYVKNPKKEILKGKSCNNNIEFWSLSKHPILSIAVQFVSTCVIYFINLFLTTQYTEYTANHHTGFFLRSVQCFCQKHGSFYWLSKQSRCSGFFGQKQSQWKTKFF